MKIKKLIEILQTADPEAYIISMDVVEDEKGGFLNIKVCDHEHEGEHKHE
jgi:hypothetical protein